MADYRINVFVDPSGAVTGSKRVQTALTSTTTAADRLRQVLTRAFAVLGGALGVTQLVRTLAQFEQAMSTVQAVTGATADQFDRLNEVAQSLGETTRFSATEAANAMTFLARAGFDTAEILGSIEGTLQLAQAGAIGLADAADISSNVLTGFRLEVDEIARVVDVMALATNRSNQNIRQLGDAMKFVGPVASGVAADFEEIVASLGALADAGLQGSLGGTGLRRVISELESPAQKTLEIFRALGVQMEEIRPSVVGVVSAIERLAEAGVDTGLALEIFGDRGGPAFEVLSNSVPKIREMTAALKEAEGTAVEMARVMDDNLNGALLRVRSAFEAVVLSFGDFGASGALSGALDQLATALRFVAANMEESANVAAVFIGALALPRLTAIAAGIAGIGTATGALATALGVATGAARLLGRALVVGLAIEGVQAAINNWDLIIERIEQAGEAVENIYEAFSREIAIPALGTLLGDAEAAALAWQALEQAVVDVFNILGRDVAVPIFDLLTGDFQGFVDGLNRLGGHFGELYSILGREIEIPLLDVSLIEAAAQAVDFLIQKWHQLVELVSTGISIDNTSIGRAIDDVDGFFSRIRDGFSNIFGGSGGLEGLDASAFGDLYEGFDRLEQRAEVTSSNIMAALVSGFQSAAADPRGLNEIGVQVASVGDSFQFLATQIEPVRDAINSLEGLDASAFGDLYEGVDLAAASYQNLTEIIEDGTQTFFDATGSSVELSRRYRDFSEDLKDLSDQIDPIGRASRELAESQEKLNLALRTGNIDAEEAARLHALLADSYRDQLDPLRALQREYERDIQIAAIPVGDRQVEAQLRNDIVQLQEQGIRLTEAEVDAHRALIEAVDAANEARQREERIYRELADPVDEYRKQMEALNVVLQQNPEFAERAAEAADRIRLAYLDTQDDPLSGLQRGAIRVAQEFSDAATLIEGAFTRAFKGAEDALVQFVTTGELNFKNLVDGIIADLARIVIRDTITGPLAEAIKGAISGATSGGGEGGGLFGGFLGQLGSIFKQEGEAGGWLTGLGAVFTTVGNSFLEVLAAVFQGGAGLFGKLFEGIGGLFGGGGGGFLGSLGGILGKAVEGISSIFGGEGGGFLGGLGNIFNSAVEGIGSIFGLSGNGGSFLSGLSSLFSGSGGAGGFLSGLSSLFSGGGAAGGFLSGLGSLAAAAGPWGIFAGGLAALFSGGAAGQWLGSLGNLFSRGIGIVGDAVGSVVSGAVDVAGKVVGGVVNTAKKVVGGVGNAVKKIFGGLFAQGGLVTPAFATGGAVTQTFMKTAPVIQKFATGGAVTQTLNKHRSMASTISNGDAIAKTFNKGGSMASTFSNGGAVTQTFNKGGSIASSFANGGAVTKTFNKGNSTITKLASGGVISGPGTGTSDSIVTALPVGSYIINAAATRRHRELLDGMSGAPRFNSGGAAVLARVSNGEYFVPPQVAQQNKSALDAINYGGLPGYQGGGIVLDLSSSVQAVAQDVTQTAISIDHTLTSVFAGVAAVVQAAIQTVEAAVSAANAVAASFASASSAPDLDFARGGSVMARVSNGEYFVPPDVASRNLPLLNTINSGHSVPAMRSGGPVRGFQNGGRVTDSAVNVVINDYRTTVDVPVSVRRERNEDGREKIVVDIQNAVTEGELDSVIDQRFGLRPAV